MSIGSPARSPTGGGATRRVHLAEALSYRGAPDRAAAAA
jgi:hypothetical protein